MKIARAGTTTRWSDTVTYQNTVYVVEVPQTLDADIETQSQELLTSLATLLDLAGSSKSHLLMATIYLADIRHIERFNAIWEAWLPSGTAPVRACIEAKLANPGYKIEIQAIAATR
ncbi:MAG: RidA family protein [Pseudomonadota bacterium]